MSSFLNLFSEPEAEPNAGKAKSASLFDLFEDPEAPPASGSTAEAPAPEVPCALASGFRENRVFWAMRNIPVQEATRHFLVCGTTGSGKSTAIRLFLQSIARRFHEDREYPEQLIVFDAKGDMIPVLSSLGLQPTAKNVCILNPFDSRSKVWNFADGVQEPAMARHLAVLLIPEEKHQGRYFTDASRELLYAVVLALNSIAGKGWTFRDLLCAMESAEHIMAVTARYPRAKAIAWSILNDERHSGAVLSTLATRLGQFEQVAALWATHPSAEYFSIEKFFAQPGVLILGNDPTLKESIWPINAVVLKALTDHILRQPDLPSEVRHPRFWFIFDEFSWMNNVACIHDLLNRGRSKGASVLIGFQTLEGLIEIYNEHGANDILSQCAHKTFLRAGGPKTAEWAEHFFGKIRHKFPVYSETTGREHSVSINYPLTEHSLFIASEFLNIPFPGPGLPYVAINDVPSLGCTLITKRPSSEVFSWLTKPADGANIERRTAVEDQTLVPWTEDQCKFYCEAPDSKEQEKQAPEDEKKKTPMKPWRKKFPTRQPTKGQPEDAIRLDF